MDALVKCSVFTVLLHIYKKKNTTESLNKNQWHTQVGPVWRVDTFDETKTMMFLRKFVRNSNTQQT